MQCRVFISPVIDLVNGLPANALHRLGISSVDPNERGGLIDEVELVIGMECIVTEHIDTQLGLANGSRGIIYGIGVHPDDELLLGDTEVRFLHDLTRLLLTGVKAKVLLSRPLRTFSSSLTMKVGFNLRASLPTCYRSAPTPRLVVFGFVMVMILLL